MAILTGGDRIGGRSQRATSARGGEESEDVLLASAVLAALGRAEEIGANSVAIPAISTGVYGFPVERAAEISIAAAKTFTRGAHVVERILYCVFDERTAEIFQRELEK